MPAAAVTLLGMTCVICVSPAPASPLLDQKRAQLDRVHTQIHRLDLRVEQLDERYNAAVLRASLLNRRIAVTTRALHAQLALLRERQATLARLLVASYKGDWHSDTVMLVLGSNDLGDFMSSYEIRARVNAAVAGMVEEVAAARQRISEHRQQLTADRHAVERSRLRIAEARTTITSMFKERRRLERRLGEEVVIAAAADRIGQAGSRGPMWERHELLGSRRIPSFRDWSPADLGVILGAMHGLAPSVPPVSATLRAWMGGGAWT
jgi:hypothetical protein